MANEGCCTILPTFSNCLWSWWRPDDRFDANSRQVLRSEFAVGAFDLVVAAQLAIGARALVAAYVLPIGEAIFKEQTRWINEPID